MQRLMLSVPQIDHWAHFKIVYDLWLAKVIKILSSESKIADPKMLSLMCDPHLHFVFCLPPQDSSAPCSSFKLSQELTPLFHKDSQTSPLGNLCFGSTTTQLMNKTN